MIQQKRKGEQTPIERGNYFASQKWGTLMEPARRESVLLILWHPPTKKGLQGEVPSPSSLPIKGKMDIQMEIDHPSPSPNFMRVEISTGHPSPPIPCVWWGSIGEGSMSNLPGVVQLVQSRLVMGLPPGHRISRHVAVGVNVFRIWTPKWNATASC